MHGRVLVAHYGGDTTVAESNWPCVASRGVYSLRMPEVSSVRAQWPVSSEHIHSGLGSSRPIAAARESDEVVIRTAGSLGKVPDKQSMQIGFSRR